MPSLVCTLPRAVSKMSTSRISHRRPASTTASRLISAALTRCHESGCTHCKMPPDGSADACVARSSQPMRYWFA